MKKVNFEDIFPFKEVSEDLSSMIFVSEGSGGNPLDMKVEISRHPDPLLPNVYNLGFGVVDDYGNLDDLAQSQHGNVNKMLSTVLFYGFFFLNERPDCTLGIDGSNDGRAYMYHRMIHTNRDYLEKFFAILGVDWYVRLLRSGKVETDYHGNPFFKPKPEPFEYSRPAQDLYRYYLFHLKGKK